MLRAYKRIFVPPEGGAWSGVNLDRDTSALVADGVKHAVDGVVVQRELRRPFAVNEREAMAVDAGEDEIIQ
jgi:hypothetical protein